MNDIASKMTLNRIRAVCPDARGDIIETIMTDAATQFVAPGPDTLLAAIHFLAQCAAETGGLKRLDENMNYSALRLTQVFPGKFPNIASTAGYVGDPEKIANYVYGNRLGNGPPSTGDGWRYRGSGLIQLTGKENFKRIGDLVGMPLVDEPELARLADSALAIAVGYWKARKINEVATADTDEAVAAVTKRINPAMEGLDRRKSYFRKAVKAFIEPAERAQARAEAAAARGTRGTRAASRTGTGAELSGVHWVARFPTSREIDDLASPFKENTRRFVAAMRAGGATVTISATRRPRERAYLMHWAWRIARQNYAPDNIQQMPGVAIIWDHGSARASKAAAQTMVDAYGMVQIAALNSEHIEGRAIDMTISWQGTLAIADKDGAPRRIASQPRNGSNVELVAIGRGYGVIKLLSDPPHWSLHGT